MIATMLFYFAETPQILKSLKNVNLEVGENLTLTCQVRGHPKPTLKWFHNGKEMVADFKSEFESTFFLNFFFLNLNNVMIL